MEDIQERIQRFITSVVERLGPVVQCIVLTGSRARGDARVDSDIDLWVFLSHIHSDFLAEIGRIVAEMKGEPEINPQCVTVSEARSPGFRKSFSTVQLHLDGVVLHGQLAIPEPTTEEIGQDRNELAVFVLMSARHYLSVQETEERLRQKLDRWLLKPLGWAIRYDVLLRTGRYWKDMEQLREGETDAESKHLIEVCRQVRLGNYRGDCMSVLQRTISVCTRILADGMMHKA